ncbi:MAG: hypothetical protein IJ200_13070 [Prevotella sp.]|nr:hypothetical protein [Prevotella sp.]
MKKTYMNPDIQVVKINTGMLLNSSPMNLTPGEATGSGKLNSTDAEGDAMGRMGFFDDDEE